MAFCLQYTVTSEDFIQFLFDFTKIEYKKCEEFDLHIICSPFLFLHPEIKAVERGEGTEAVVFLVYV